MLHDGHAIRDLRHHAEIMRDEEHRRAFALLQIADQRQDLCLGGDIQGRGRFIGYQHHRIKRQCHRNHGALALPARKLMREGARGFRRVRDAHFIQQCQHAGFNLGIAQAGMDTKHLRDLITNAAQRIERGHGFLEHHGNAGTAQRAHGCLIRAGEVLALKQDAAARNAYIARQQAHDGARHHGFSGTAFANHAEDLASMKVKRDLPQRLRPIRPARQGDRQALQGKYRAHRPFSLGFSASFKPCPTRETASTVNRMATPGMAETYHCTRSTSRPRPIRLPQDVTLGSDSRRKAKALSSRMATAMTTLA